MFQFSVIRSFVSLTIHISHMDVLHNNNLHGIYRWPDQYLSVHFLSVWHKVYFMRRWNWVLSRYQCWFNRKIHQNDHLFVLVDFRCVLPNMSLCTFNVHIIRMSCVVYRILLNAYTQYPQIGQAKWNGEQETRIEKH